MQLIEDHENISREFYGGAIGFMGFNGDFNHAIIIRSFLSKTEDYFTKLVLELFLNQIQIVKIKRFIIK